MSDLKEARREFYATRELLKHVHTQEEFKVVKGKLEKYRKFLLVIDPEFRALIDELERKQKMEQDKLKAELRAKIDEKEIRAESARREVEKAIDSWIQDHRIKKRSLEEVEKAEKHSNEPLWCPICCIEDPPRNWINEESICAKCTPNSLQGHRLVPKSELKNYNRKYRRRWRRARGL